jgi:hypothetical protein
MTATPPNLPAQKGEPVYVVNQIGVITIAVGVAIGAGIGSLVAVFLLAAVGGL